MGYGYALDLAQHSPTLRGAIVNHLTCALSPALDPERAERWADVLLEACEDTLRARTYGGEFDLGKRYPDPETPGGYWRLVDILADCHLDPVIDAWAQRWAEADEEAGGP